jgi:uncharacterized protein YuzB (UPF0349 family)
MPGTVEYCLANVGADARAALREADCRTVEKLCLQRCGSCTDGPLLVVDGEPRTAESHAALLADLDAGASRARAEVGAETDAGVER